MLLFIYGERQRHKIMPKIISCEGMDVSRDDPDLAITVLTCEGDLRDPAFPHRLTQIICKLKGLVSDDNKKPFQVTKVEPWNSVRVTFNIPRNAAQRLRQLAERGDNTLRELGILSVQIEGDQVITLTLANSFNESNELLIGKSSESVVNNTNVTFSTVNSSLNINNNLSEITLNYNNVNNTINTTSSSVSSVVSNINLIGSPTSGSSVEITRKNIAQYLSQQHLDVVNNTSNPSNVLAANDSISGRLPAFRSPNVVAPINTEPIPYFITSSNTVTSQASTSVSSTASTCNTSSSASNRLSNVTSIANSSLREIQSNYGLFPFASMQYAMHTKQGLNASHYTSVQRPNQVITTPSIRLPLTFGQTQVSQSLPNNPCITPSVSTTTSIASAVSNISTVTKPQPIVRDVMNIKVCQSLTSQQPQQTISTQTSQTQPTPTTVAVASVNQNSNNPNGASANVALTSPLLVNLLQSDATSGHLKGPPPPPSTLNQINASTDLTQKRKARKTRKSKEKIESEVTQTTLFGKTTPVTQTITLSSAQTTVTIAATTSPSLKLLSSNPFPQQSGVDSSSQMQTKSSFNISPHLISIPLSAMTRFPSIHPEAQGQPQVVRAGHLPLRAQLSRPQISSSKVGSPPIAATHLRKPLFVTTSQASGSKLYPSTERTISNAQTKPREEKSSLNISNTSVDTKNVKSEKESEANPVFPSPPTSRMTNKTKHLINPFTGLLEPMLSDEEEEDRPSPATLFPELDAGSDVGGNSERSLSDAGSNGKDNNHSSDTDSGLGKSGTDVSSQSSIDVGNGDNTLIHSKILANDAIPAPESAIDKLKLKVKNENKTESTKVDTFPTTPTSIASFHSRSHFTKQKSSEPSNPLSCVTTTTQSIENATPVVMAEPRVPPLHISIRGPNSAVVVSNRRDSTSEIEMKTTNVPKKGRGVRTTRAMSAESSLTVTECTNNLNKNQRKKLQREQRFLSGGGIVTSNLSLCASPSVESLFDINKTLNDSSFTLSESVDSVFLQSSQRSSNCAQNNNNNNSNNSNISNISTNKCVPHLNSDYSDSQECAIHVTSDNLIKASFLPNSETIISKTNTNLDSINKTVSTSLSLASNLSEISDSNNDKSDVKCVVKQSSPDNQKVESSLQTCHTNNEMTNSESLPSETVFSLPQTDQKEITVKQIEKNLENVKNKSRKLPVAAVVTVEPMLNISSETIVNKITRIGRMNCIPSSLPALVNTRDLKSVRNLNVLHSTETTSSLNCFNDNIIENEFNETIVSNQNTSIVTTVVSNMTQSVENPSENTIICVTDKTFNALNSSENKQIIKNEVILNGDTSSERSESPTALSDSNNFKTNFESNTSNTNGRVSDSPISNLVKTDETNNELNVINESQIDCQKIDIQSGVQKEESIDKSREIPINTNSSVSESTATSEDFVKTDTKSSVKRDSNTETSDSGQRVSETLLKTSKLTVVDGVKDVIISSVNNESQNAVNETSKTDKTIDSRSDETAKQPLQIVITTTVPSFTTNTSTPMFSQLKSSSLESGSRVTLITFKSNHNSPNTPMSTSGKASDLSSTSMSNQMPPKAVPFKLLTIPSGSGGITVRSAANKLVELINSTASSPVSPLSPNTLPSGGSPLPMSTTSPPVRLLVSKMATAGNVSQTGVPVSVAGNSIGQLVVVKSVVVTNPSPSIKLVPAKSPSINTPSLLIPFSRTNSPNESLNAINVNNEQKPKETSHSSHSLKTNEIINSVTNDDNSSNGSDVQNQDSNSIDNDFTQLEPMNLTVQCPDSQSITSSDDTKIDDTDRGGIPRLIRTSNVTQNDILSDEDIIDDNNKLHSVASDHNYIMKKSTEEEDSEEEILNLSNTTENDSLDVLKDNDIMKFDDFENEHSLHPQLKQSHDMQSRPNKRKSSENAAELIKACMGVEDAPKKNSTFNSSQAFSVASGVSTRGPNMSTRTRATSLDNDCITTSETSEPNYLNKSKTLRLRKSKVSSSEPPFTPDNNCSSDEEIAIKDNSGIAWGNKPRLRTGTAPKNQKINKQKNMNCIKDSNKEKIANRSNEKGKKGRDRDQSKTSSTQRSTRRSRDHNIMISTSGINLHTSESSSEPLHMEIVGLELSNDSTNNYNNNPTTASTTSPMITSSLLVKRKTRVGINNTEQSESNLTKRRRIVKENHR